MIVIKECQIFTVMLLMVMVQSSLVRETMGHPCGRTFLSALIQLVPCRPSVAPFSTLPPNELCCAAIKTLGQPCLCVLAKGPPIVGVDRTLALHLPGKCSANFPPCEIFKYKHCLTKEIATWR